MISRSLIMAVLLLSACGAREEPIETASEARAIVSGNGITRNGITRNGITRNGITRNGNTGETSPMVDSGLHNASIDVEDPDAAREFLPYLVSCALSKTQSATIEVNGESASYAGELGLSPEWRTGACGEDCQHWNTACLLARTNAFGVHVNISMRASKIASSLLERLTYSQEEGAFFGNLFVEGGGAYACVGRMFDTPVGDVVGRMQRRVCSDESSAEDCGMTDLGPCRNFLLPPYALGTERVCLGEQVLTGAMVDCADHLGTPNFPAGTVIEPRVITTFLDPLQLPIWAL